MGRTWLVCVTALALAMACDNQDPTDAGMDGGGVDSGATDAGPEPLALPGLDGPVEVIIDDRGMPHIYATTVHDLMFVEGYLMSRDRFIQMEFLRRNVVGRLAEVVGVVAPSIVETDRGQRFFGFERTGQAIYDSLPATDETRLVTEAFVGGINLYIDSVVLADDYAPPPGLEVMNIIRSSPNFGHWHPRDIFALARFQAWNLSYDAGADIARTEALLGVRAAFSPTDGNDRIAARAGIYSDFFSEVQARRVYTRDDGFNDGTTTAFLPPITRPRLPGALEHFPRASLRGGAAFFERLQRNPYMARDEHVGSNSWVVDGDHTASGNPILSNDPHLSLISPGVWWMVHLNTEMMGGENDIDAQGVAFAGLPGIVLGYTRNVAWSATTTGYDVTDVYAEAVTFRNDGDATTPDWVPVSVEFEAADVNLETITEEILVAGGAPVSEVLYVVPHHGPLIPDSFVLPMAVDPPTGGLFTGSAMSVRYTGHEVSNELAFFVDLLTAQNVQEAFDAQDAFVVGAQNFSFADSSGNIGWSTSARIPQRSCTFWLDAMGRPVVDVSAELPLSPLFVLPGTGGYEWGADLADQFIPHDQNPARGYIATANQDNVGVTDDGNPCNDAHYIGGGFAVGYRQFRIRQRLDTAVGAGGITTDDMIALQAETRSSLGETMRDAIVASLDHAIGTTSDDAALDAVVTAAGAAGVADLTEVRDRLMAWSLETPHGVGATAADEIADSVATTIFNATITRLAPLAFRDEEALIGRGMNSSYTARMLEWALADAADQQALPLRTFMSSYDGFIDWNDTVVWDDISTPAVFETRDERVTRAALAAVAWLESGTGLGTDWDQWRWGRLHAVRFGQIVPATAGPEIVSIPPADSTEFPIGFPRHGDYGAIDVGNFGMTNGERFTHGSGASQRLVVEMTPTGPVPFNALPGGQSEDVNNPHHADEAEHWRVNEQPPLHFTRADVEANAETVFLFVPPSR